MNYSCSLLRVTERAEGQPGADFSHFHLAAWKKWPLQYPALLEEP